MIIASITIIFFVSVVQCVTYQSGFGNTCPRNELDRCVKMAEPLLRNPNYVFPSNKEDISTVCRTWNEFVNCVRRYTSTCSSTDRRKELQTAVDDAVKTANDLCTNTNYQKDYLKHAPCIKTMATDEGKCRKQLNYLVDQVSANSISNAQICCAHHAFRECIITATSRHCESNSNGAAVRFTRDMFSKALAFLLKQCEHYIPNSGDCPGVSTLPANTWSPTSTQERPRPTQNEFTTTYKPYFPSWTKTTYQPWYPGGENSVETPNQQGLSSGVGKMVANLQYWIISSIFYVILLTVY